jgi:2-methylaconitate cis-trans-isomerase PrpF
MPDMVRATPCAILRGGTSKGVFFLDSILPVDPVERDAFLIRIMGSPDARQIDGLGGADPLTSKVAIVAPSTRPGIDLEYESIEIGIGQASVNRTIMCGNLLAAVGCFALAEGLVGPGAAAFRAMVYCRNNGKLIELRMPAADAAAAASGSESTVSMNFVDPAGAVTGRLLPTGRAVDPVRLPDGRMLRCSLVDAGTLYGFLPAADFGLTGSEPASDLDEMRDFRKAVELVRESVVAMLNSTGAAGRPLETRGLKLAIVGGGQADASDIAARVINTARVHKAYAVSGGICLAAAAAIDGTVVSELMQVTGSPQSVRIAHPSGTLTVIAHFHGAGETFAITGAELHRTARIVMRGSAYG